MTGWSTFASSDSEPQDLGKIVLLRDGLKSTTYEFARTNYRDNFLYTFNDFNIFRKLPKKNPRKNSPKILHKKHRNTIQHRYDFAKKTDAQICQDYDLN